MELGQILFIVVSAFQLLAARKASVFMDEKLKWLTYGFLGGPVSLFCLSGFVSLSSLYKHSAPAVVQSHRSHS